MGRGLTLRWKINENKIRIAICAGQIIFGILFFGHSRAGAETIEESFASANSFFEAGDYTNAVKGYEAVITQDPNYAPAYNGLGLVYRTLGEDLNDVAWFFKSALDIDPNYLEACENLANTYYDLRDFDKAEKYFLKALSFNPDLLNSQFRLAWLYLLGKSQPNQAAMYFKKCWRIRKSLTPISD